MSMKCNTYHKGDSTFYTTCRCNCGGNFQCIVKAHVRDGKVVVPFSVYMKFQRPESIAGREVVYVEGRNGNKIKGSKGGQLGDDIREIRHEDEAW